MNIATFILCCFGLTQIIVYGSILDVVRPTKGALGKLFKCPMCVGFWAGVFLWALNGFTELFTFDDSLMTGFLLGCLSSGTSYVFNVLFGDEGFKVEHSGIQRRNKTNYRRWK